MLKTITMAFCSASFGPVRPARVVMMGVPAITPVRHSNSSDRPEPLGPPSGSRVTALAASTVGFPSVSIATPSGIGLPSAAA
jgi:hypothetical protein